jgi:predicted transcriptional regulator
MKVIKISQVPPRSVQVEDSVQAAIAYMGAEAGCAVAVLDGDKLAGTLSKDDVLTRLVAQGLSPATTKVREIMTSPPATVALETEADEALRLMFSLKQCYLPVVDDRGAMKGWIAICNLFQNNVEDLTTQLESLAAYIAADGPGG